jgi:putative molybdopterin biosynthesis protein
LLDPESGEYNLPYIRQYLPGRKLRVVILVGRVQGLILAPGNPKSVAALQDLVREDIRFVNRQPGAGTRYLLDYHLGQLEIAPDEIQGYQREEFTHLTAAAAVASNRADCTLGIQAAATALDLDFIPLFQERYDLIIPRENMTDTLLGPLFDLLHDKKFQAAVSSRPGYDVSQMGQVVADLPGAE